MHRAQARTQKGDGMIPQGQPDMAVILDHLGAGCHGPKGDKGLDNLGH
jgi:hypothetical protein